LSFGNLYCAGVTPACRWACKFLSEAGISISDAPGWDTGHLLLDVPSFRPGLWKEESLDTLLSSLPNDIIIWGGNLAHSRLEPYKKFDLLKDEAYLLENADITADCTIPIAESALSRPWPEISALVIGWGRIGKFLSAKLQNLGCDVTIASRNPYHRCEAESLGLHTKETLEGTLEFDLIINTAPAYVLYSREREASVKIDLASIRGIAGDDVIWARGLPGKYAPERSGKLIADTVLRLSREVC